MGMISCFEVLAGNLEGCPKPILGFVSKNVEVEVSNTKVHQKCRNSVGGKLM